MKKHHSMPIAAAALLSLVAAACSSDSGSNAVACSSEELGGTAFAPVTEVKDVTAAAAPVTPILGQGDKPVVKVGWFGDLTGATSSFTISSKQAAQLAIEQANEEGHLNVTVQFVAKDNKDASEATAPAIEQSFIQDDAMVGVIGGAFSGETLAVGELFAEAGLTHISPSATNPDITTKGWPFFRLLSTDTVQAEKAAELIEALGCTKVAVVDDKSDYGKGLADLVEQNLTDAGVEIVAREGAEPATDYTALTDTLEAEEPELVFYGGYGPQASLILKQMRESGVDAVFMSGDGTKDQSFVKDAGTDVAEGTILTCPCSDPTAATDDESVAFVEAYRERWNEDPGIYGAEGYDAGLLMTSAIDAADDDGEVTREEIFEFFDNAEGIDELTKTFTWDDTGEIEGGVIIAYVVRDGKIVQLGSTDDLDLG
jgi:branched-chain amino acid transport system substrate-binding protein